MNETTKSLVRHIITALSFVLGLVGLNKFTGLLDIVTQNIDGLFAAIATIAGVVGSIIGFFRNKERLSKGAGIVLLLFTSNFIFASEFRPVYSIGFPDGDCPGYVQSGAANHYALALSGSESLPSIE